MKETNFVSCFLEVDLKFDKNASLLKHQKIAYCEKLFEYNEVAIRYVAPLKVAPKLGLSGQTCTNNVVSIYPTS